jgi:hypothetical protein
MKRAGSMTGEAEHLERVKRMNRMRVRLWLLVVLVLLVAPGLVHARPTADERTAARAAEPGILGQAWDWLVSMFGNGGSFIDPLGSPGNGIPPSSLNNIEGGSFIDPLGGGQ